MAESTCLTEWLIWCENNSDRVALTSTISGVTRGTAPGDTLQGSDTWRNFFVGKFTKNSRETKKGRQVFQEKIDGWHPQLPPQVSSTQQCESKNSPLKLFAVFSLLVNLCNWKLSWLLPRHIPMSTPILVHLSAYLCEMYHFYRCDPSDFKNLI